MTEAYNLKAGDEIEVWSIDTKTGYRHRDSGKLVGLNRDEVALAVEGAAGEVRVHYPRWGFNIARKGEGHKMVNGA